MKSLIFLKKKGVEHKKIATNNPEAFTHTHQTENAENVPLKKSGALGPLHLARKIKEQGLLEI